MDNKKSNLLQGTLYLMISSLAFMISSYLINIWLGRYLGPAIYGKYGIIISLITLVNLTQTAGLPQAVSKFISAEDENTEAIYRTGFFIQIISTVIVIFLIIIFSTFLANIFKDPELAQYIALSSLIVPAYGMFALLAGFYNGRHQFKSQAFLQLIFSVVKILSVSILAYFFGLYGVIVGFIISPTLAFLLKIHIPKITLVSYSYKKLILFSIPLIGVAIFINLLQTVDLFFVKIIMQSDKYTGLYTADQNIAEIPFFALTALGSVLLPSISRSVSQNSHAQTSKLISKSLRFCLLILIPSVMLISATSSQILTFLFSSPYLDGAKSLSILVFGSGFFTIFSILSTIISSSGFPYKSAILAGIGVLISSFFCLFLIPRYGLNGAALATTIAASLMMSGAALIVYRKFKVFLSIKSLIKIFISSFVIYILARYIIIQILFLPIYFIFLLGVYILLLIIIKEISRDDIELAKNLLPLSLTKLFIRNKR